MKRFIPNIILTAVLFASWAYGQQIAFTFDDGPDMTDIAFQDPVYGARPRVLPAGESILWSLAKERGLTQLRYPGEDDVYEKPLLDRLHL